MSLRAPVAVPVEIRSGDRRYFRLSRSVGVDGLRLVRPAPFEPGRPAQIAFLLPDLDEALSLRVVVALTDDDGEGEHGGRELTFQDPPVETRATLAQYVAVRLGLPVSP